MDLLVSLDLFWILTTILLRNYTWVLLWWIVRLLYRFIAMRVTKVIQIDTPAETIRFLIPFHPEISSRKFNQIFRRISRYYSFNKTSTEYHSSHIKTWSQHQESNDKDLLPFSKHNSASFMLQRIMNKRIKRRCWDAVKNRSQRNILLSQARGHMVYWTKEREIRTANNGYNDSSEPFSNPFQSSIITDASSVKLGTWDNFACQIHVIHIKKKRRRQRTKADWNQRRLKWMNIKGSDQPNEH